MKEKMLFINFNKSKMIKVCQENASFLGILLNPKLSQYPIEVCLFFYYYNNSNIMYQNLEPPQSNWSKIYRSFSPIISITLLNHAMCIMYSMMTFKQESSGFISIIIGSVAGFFLSSSHLTIYGISILGILYLKMLQPYYSRVQIHYIVAISGAIIFPVWKIMSYVNKIFDSFPGRVHASMIFGTALITLFKFFPLAIENINGFYIAANSNALTNPWETIVLTFKKFNILTLLFTFFCLIIYFFVRNKLYKIPIVPLLVLIGILINSSHFFLDYKDLCQYPDVDCKLYLIKLENTIPIPKIHKLILMIPSAAVLTVILTFQQFLYLQEFQRNSKRYFGEGNLGQTFKQSKTLAFANLISGLFGGLPICINLFATHENFSYHVKSGSKATKLVGFMQIPISYLIFSIFKWIYEIIPLFILFIIVGTPIIYFIKNMLRIHHRHILFISCLGSLNVVTHPIIALILASFISIHDISLMLKDRPYEILVENIDEDGQRRSSRISYKGEQQIVQKVDHSSQFAKRVLQIQTDQPSKYESESYVLYRFAGAVSYLNYFEHIQVLTKLIEKYIKKYKIPLLLSFRYCQLIDQLSLQQFALFIERIQREQVEVIFTGLHKRLVVQMQRIKFFEEMLRKDSQTMYRIDHVE